MGADKLYLLFLLIHMQFWLNHNLGAVSTLAGSGAISWLDGVGTAALMCNPRGVVVASNGDVFFTDTGNMRIRMISTSG